MRLTNNFQAFYAKVDANFKNLVIVSIVFVCDGAGEKTICGDFAMESVISRLYFSIAALNRSSFKTFRDGNSRQPPCASTVIFFTLNVAAYDLSTAIIRRFNTSSGIAP